MHVAQRSGSGDGPGPDDGSPRVTVVHRKGMQRSRGSKDPPFRSHSGLQRMMQDQISASHRGGSSRECRSAARGGSRPGAPRPSRKPGRKPRPKPRSCPGPDGPTAGADAAAARTGPSVLGHSPPRAAMDSGPRPGTSSGRARDRHLTAGRWRSGPGAAALCRCPSCRSGGSTVRAGGACPRPGGPAGECAGARGAIRPHRVAQDPPEH
jgi:hypothetical protein